MAYPVVKLVGTNIIAQIDQRLPKLPVVFAEKLEKRMSTIRRKVQAITAIEPPPPTYPLMNKMTPKQRRYVWAKINEQGGPPTIRTGAVLAAYDVISIPSGNRGEVLLLNPNPAAPYVIGEQQQRFHADTGYIQIDTVQPQNEAIVLQEAGFAFDDAVTELL